MVICLERDVDLHMAQLMPLPLTVSCFSKIQIGLPFWSRLIRVVPEKGLLNGCVCVLCVEWACPRDVVIKEVGRKFRSLYIELHAWTHSEVCSCM